MSKLLPRNCGGRYRQLPNKKWQAQLALPGNKYGSIGTFDTDRQAANEVIQALAEAEAFGLTAEGLIARRRATRELVATQKFEVETAAKRNSLKWWCEVWLSSHERRREDGLVENEGVISNYRSYLKNYVWPLLGEMPIAELSTDQCYQWLEWVKVQPRADGQPGYVSATIIKKTYVVFRRILRDAVRRRVPGVQSNPLEAGLELPTVVKRTMYFPTLEEFQRILSHADEWAKDLMIFLAFSGLRFSEACAITYEDVRLDGVQVNKQLKLVKGGKRYFADTKDHAERVQPLSQPARAALQRQLLRYPDQGVRLPRRGVVKDVNALVWRSEEGSFLIRGNWNEVWHRCRIAAGVPTCRPHDMRRAFGNYLVDEKVDMRRIQILLGHSQQRTTEIYLGRNPKRLQEAVSSLDGLLGTDGLPALPAGG